MSESFQFPSEDERSGFSGLQKIVILGLAAINFFVFAGLWYLSGDSETTNTPISFAAGESLGLRSTYEQALLVAHRWQNDAQLANVTTSWQLASGDAFTLQRPAWSFSFYSPSVDRIQIVTVDELGAQSGRQQVTPTAPQRVVPDWELESEDLLLTFLSYGGHEFLGLHPGANIHLQLKADSEGRSIWHISAVDQVARESLSVAVDAGTRQIIPNDSNKGGA